ncbi:LysR family transcriptional regulator [Paenibacillus protaetiae]|uniref:LysR family transcriptional regulator n=1 Tax=Paenibacillus protaetiae TaxID=2509456 RepID=A0A4P6EUQ7_9BACL|nr:LysR family transcriptional regulator [Paenibacillus protaetiae]QAY66684.1 LysR family transcriptional regulator [Paenibacillus protaetiae]
MEIRHLQYITEIMRHNSFTKAAQALHITQPSISKMIKGLENELSLEVFNRDSKQVKLTDTGETIVRYAQPILQLFDDLMTELHDLSSLRKGSIRIGLPPMTGANFFPVVMKQFQERYPGIAVQMVEEGAKKIEEWLGEGSLDVGVVLLPVDPDSYHVIPLVQEQVMVAMHPGHRLAAKEQLALEELAEEPFLLFASGFALHDRIIAACEQAGFMPRIVYESSQWDFLREMAAANLGITMLPETICRSFDPGKVKAVPLARPVIPWQPAMAWRKEGYLSHASRAWIAFIEQKFSRSSGETGDL